MRTLSTVKAMALPSGDQDGSNSSVVPLLKGVIAPVARSRIWML
jgi:hypothetical protein